ncbi:MAG: hypothetical protein CW691_08550 [Candidatus Bathyarchaeum sp.]|nr:MAG: hypothetical protein CW691_08550 [Candidatus Bathyarchaeum sp.]
MGDNDVWHYILPFPFENEKRRLIWNVLQSKVGKSLLMNMKLDGRTYQKDLINGTAYSNKSIIEYLKKMVSADILEQGMEQVAAGKRKVRVKWYVPTKLGRWFILFLKPTEDIAPEMGKKIIKEIFHVYASSIVEVCENFGIDINVFRNILNTEYDNKTT